MIKIFILEKLAVTFCQMFYVPGGCFNSRFVYVFERSYRCHLIALLEP